MSIEKNGAYPFQAIVENQEERIQRLEDDRVSTAGHIAEQGAVLKGIKEDVSELGNKMDKVIARFDKKFELEDKKKEKDLEKKKFWVRKAAYTILIGGGGTVAGWVLQHFLK